MAAWALVDSLVSLRNEFNALAPARDRTSDGSIGDTSHAAASSDHNPDETGNTPTEDADSTNEVHAIDVDANLRKAGWTMQRAVDIIVGRHRAGEDNRLQNVIYNRRIWSRSWGWTARAYSGASPHTEHAHFSARYTAAQESDTRPWGLLEDDMTKADFLSWLQDPAIRKALCTAVMSTDGVLKAPSDDPANPYWSADSYARLTYNAAIAARTGVAALADKDMIDEPAIIAGVLAGLPPEKIAAAIPPELAAQVADILAARLAA